MNVFTVPLSEIYLTSNQSIHQWVCSTFFSVARLLTSQLTCTMWWNIVSMRFCRTHLYEMNSTISSEVLEITTEKMVLIVANINKEQNIEKQKQARVEIWEKSTAKQIMTNMVFHLILMKNSFVPTKTRATENCREKKQFMAILSAFL